MQVIYDTMSKNTVLMLRDVEGQNTPSFYDIAQSETAHQMYNNEKDKSPKEMNLDFGNV
jgi:hypothetical protein